MNQLPAATTVLPLLRQLAMESPTSFRLDFLGSSTWIWFSTSAPSIAVLQSRPPALRRSTSQVMPLDRAQPPRHPPSGTAAS